MVLVKQRIQWEGDENQRPLVDRTCVLNEGEWAPAEPPNRTTILWTDWWTDGTLDLDDSDALRRSWQLPTMIWFLFLDC